MNTPPKVINPQIVLYGLLIIVVLWIIYLLMKRIGLIKTQADIKEVKERTEAVQNLENSKYFDPNLYKQTSYGYAHLLPSTTANYYAKEIKSSWGWFNDDEERVYSAFRSLTSKIQISQVADAYAQLYKSDLLGDIVHYFNAKEKAFLWKIIDSKPIA